MLNWAAAITRAQTADVDLQRRSRLLIIIAIGMTLFSLAFIPVLLSTVANSSSLILLLSGAALSTVSALLGRTGRVTLGSYILIGFTLAAIAGSIPQGNTPGHTPFFMILPVLFAGILLPPRHVWGVLALAIAGIALGALLLPPEMSANPQWRQGLLGASLMLIIVALITSLSAQTTARALAAAQRAREEAEAANAALAASNAALEARVEERTTALRQIAEEQRAVASQLQTSLEAQQDLNRVIAELSVPIIPISKETLVVPLVGNIDSVRAEQLLTAVLEQVEASGARTVVLDVTGVALVDTQVAGALLRVADAARLMGAEAMLVGIRPEVAQTLVHLGVELTTLRTAATLQDSLSTVGVTSRR